jgi:hypothetical protein
MGMDNVFGDTPKKKFTSEIFSAEDARRKASLAAKMKAEEELIPVFNCIRYACKQGKFEVDYPRNLSTFACSKLKELGYSFIQITLGDYGDDNKGYRIKWPISNNE